MAGDHYESVRQAPGLKITVEGDEARRRIAVSGELDLGNCRALEEEMRAAEYARPERIVFDLTGLELIDSAGVACLVHALQRSERSQTKLEFVHGPKAVERVFQIAGIADMLPPAGDSDPLPPAVHD